MPSASYADPRLAALYDALNPSGAAGAFYLSLPGAEPGGSPASSRPGGIT
jgi:hypothetical protein